MNEELSNRYIVVVEDDVNDLQVVQSVLLAGGYVLKCFEDGAKAWEFLQADYKNIGVIILAKTLPNIAGMELLTKIQQHNFLKDVPVIVQTVDSGDGKYTNALELGAQFYIEKPIDTKKLLRLVKASIRSYKSHISGEMVKELLV